MGCWMYVTKRTEDKVEFLWQLVEDIEAYVRMVSSFSSFLFVSRLSTRFLLVFDSSLTPLLPLLSFPPLSNSESSLNSKNRTPTPR